MFPEIATHASLNRLDWFPQQEVDRPKSRRLPRSLFYSPALIPLGVDCQNHPHCLASATTATWQLRPNPSPRLPPAAAHWNATLPATQCNPNIEPLAKWDAVLDATLLAAHHPMACSHPQNVSCQSQGWIVSAVHGPAPVTRAEAARAPSDHLRPAPLPATTQIRLPAAHCTAARFPAGKVSARALTWPAGRRRW